MRLATIVAYRGRYARMIPLYYQRTINPCLTRKETARAIRYMDKLCSRLSPEERARVLRLGEPPRDWLQL